jgi:hypothetical protein
MITLRKFAYAILIITITVGALLLLEDSQAATSINGTIYADTTWTRDGSPYTLTGDVTINNGITLTIQAGVTVNFGPYQIKVEGILNAQSTSDNKTVFSGGYSTSRIVFSSTSSGCIVDNIYFISVAIVVEKGSPLISNNYFTSTPSTLIAISGGSPSITGNVLNFDSAADCIRINSGSEPFISHNLIVGTGQNYGIYTEGTGYITYNNITGCWTGIFAVGAPTIQYNNIMDNANDGIRSENSASTVQYNVLANNDVGISVNGTIRYNTIANNRVAGIWGPNSSMTITQNNIYSNAQNVHLTEPDNITATYDWWGTTDASAINQTIWDHKNATDLGTLTFEPYLTEPNPAAPSIPAAIIIPQPPVTPTPTPSPTPTPTASPTPSVTPIPSSTITPSPTAAPTETPEKSPDQFNITDISSIAVIVVAILIAIVIIVFINRKYGKSPTSK